MKKLLIICAVFAIGVAVLLPTRSYSQRNDSGSRVKGTETSKFRPVKDPIPDQYIVVFHDWATGEKGEHSVASELAQSLAGNYGARVEKVYKHALNGFAARMTKEAALTLSDDPRVAFVEEDGMVYATATQTSPPYGLDRIDQRNLPLSGTYTYNWTGSGVRAYIIDTGIRTTHSQFGGRASNVFDAFGGSGADCNGHGTHVAGTVGGSTYGVAKGALLRGVRVLDCNGSGSNSGVIAGVDWVRQNHIAPAVANMSLGGGASTALDTAVNNLHNANVTIVVAAGNSNTNACTQSPARAANAVTVGSTTSTDARSSFSNFGTCLDLFAPGSSILSSWYTSDTATATLSGTSMASPHVCGAAALYKQAVPSASSTTIRNALVNNATTNVISGAGSGSPNRLLYTLFF